MSFLEFLPRAAFRAGQRRERRTISRAPAHVRLHAIRPRDTAETVRAWRAERSGDLPSGLRYRAGRDVIVQHGASDFGVVRADIFERTYERVEGDRFRKRRDLVLHYFTLDRPVRVKTLEGMQDAEAGDWIVQGVTGELWPVKPGKARSTYELIDRGAHDV